MADISLFTPKARQEFLDAWVEAGSRPFPASYDSMTTTVKSTGPLETHVYLSSLPRLKEFKGFSEINKLVDSVYDVRNKTYRMGPVQVAKDTFSDAQMDGYLRQIRSLPENAQKDIVRMMHTHLAAGTSTACFDGSNFFANSHTVGTGDNLDTFDGAANDAATYKVIALITNNSAMKPILFQDRESLTALMTDEGTPQAEDARQYKYWCDTRFGLGYGYWWDAIHLTITDTPTVEEFHAIIRQLINRFRTFKLPKGNDLDNDIYVHEGWMPSESEFKLLVSMNLGELARQAVTLPAYVTSGGALQTNIYHNVAEVIPTPSLN